MCILSIRNKYVDSLEEPFAGYVRGASTSSTTRAPSGAIGPKSVREAQSVRMDTRLVAFSRIGITARDCDAQNGFAVRIAMGPFNNATPITGGRKPTRNDCLVEHGAAGWVGVAI